MKKNIIIELASTMAIICASCNPTLNTISPPISTPIESRFLPPLSTPSPSQIDTYLSNIQKYYPELVNLFPRETKNLSYASNKIILYNLTNDYQLDFDQINKLIATYQIIPSLKPNIDYQLNYQAISATINSRPPKDILFFVLPENAPRTNWNQEKVTYATSSGLLGRGEVYLSFVEQKPEKIIKDNILKTTVKDELSQGMAVEGCQVTIQVKGDSVEHTQLLQEIVCNSLGIAHLFKILGYSYSQYSNIASQIVIGFSDKQASLPIIIFSEEVYTKLPNSPLVQWNKP